MQLSRDYREKSPGRPRCRIASLFLNAKAKSARNMAARKKLADKHTQKLNAAFLTELGWPAARISEALNKVHGEDALSESHVRRINKAIRDDDETILTDHRQSGESGAIRERPISGDPKNIKEVEKHIADNPYTSIRTLAALTGLSQKVIQSILEQLNMVKKFGEFVPRTLTKTKRQRYCACTKNLSLLERDGSFLERVIAEDECWLHVYEERTGEGRRQWCTADKSPRPEPHQALHEETMLVFDCEGPLLIDFVPQKRTIDSNYYCKLLNTKYPFKRPNQKHLGVSLIHDGASSHTSHKTKERLQGIGINTLQHPPYSPDISPCDYAVFGPLKRMLRGQHFDTLQDLQNEARRILEEFDAKFYETAIFDLEKRWRTVCSYDGDYLTHTRLNSEYCECCTE